LEYAVDRVPCSEYSIWFAENEQPYSLKKVAVKLGSKLASLWYLSRKSSFAILVSLVYENCLSGASGVWVRFSLKLTSRFLISSIILITLRFSKEGTL
jgi:hypothetical protein